MARVLTFAATAAATLLSACPDPVFARATDLSYDEKLRFLRAARPDVARSAERLINVTYDLEQQRLQLKR